jgi:hypothetical protein
MLPDQNPSWRVRGDAVMLVGKTAGTAIRPAHSLWPSRCASQDPEIGSSPADGICLLPDFRFYAAP